MKNGFVYDRLMKQPILGNEAKSKMKHPSDMPTPRFELGDSDMWSNALPIRPRRRRIWHVGIVSEYLGWDIPTVFIWLNVDQQPRLLDNSVLISNRHNLITIKNRLLTHPNYWLPLSCYIV